MRAEYLLFDLFVAFRAGASVVILPEFYSAFPKKMAEAIDAHGITVWNSVVSALSLMVDKVDLAKFSLASVRTVIFSGELMPMRVLRKVRAAIHALDHHGVHLTADFLNGVMDLHAVFIAQHGGIFLHAADTGGNVRTPSLEGGNHFRARHVILVRRVIDHSRESGAV